MAWFSDTFDGPAISGNWVVASTTPAPSIVTGRLHVPTRSSYPNIGTTSTINIASANVYVSCLQSGTNAASETEFSGYLSSSHEWGFNITGGTLKTYYQNGGADVFRTSITYSATTHKWLRLREASGTLYWDSSANGTTWTQRDSLANPFGTTTFTFVLSAGNWNNISTDIDAIFDNFNTLGITAIDVLSAAATATPLAPTTNTTRIPPRGAATASAIASSNRGLTSPAATATATSRASTSSGHAPPNAIATAYAPPPTLGDVLNLNVPNAVATASAFKPVIVVGVFVPEADAIASMFLWVGLSPPDEDLPTRVGIRQEDTSIAIASETVINEIANSLANLAILSDDATLHLDHHDTKLSIKQSGSTLVLAPCDSGSALDG